MENLNKIEKDQPVSEEMDVDEHEAPEINNELLNEKLEIIMQKLESINVDKEIGEKEANRDCRLVIDKIELENFKSYAGVKRIGPLHYRFNAVVGPNGSGKSNLMESLLFVFGKRAKRMRLNKLNELIHSSSTQDNLKFARVTIYFKEIRDTEEGYEEIEGSEFTLSREVYKNGSSKYLLDFKEIGFDNLCLIIGKKGIDLKHNRFLILQGEVEQISMMKPKGTAAGEIGLLEFLEDIIGTSRYVNLIEKLSTSIDELSEIKTQKNNRAKITKNDLDQLEDVKNASTEYYKEEKEMHLMTHLDLNIQRHKYDQKIVELMDKIKNFQKQIDDIEKKIQEKVSENTALLDEHRKLKKEQENFKRKKEELKKQFDSIDAEDGVKRTDIENISKLIGKTKTALEKLNKNLQTQNENIQNAKKDLPLKEKEYTELTGKKNKLEIVVNEKEHEIFTKTENLQMKKRKLEQTLQPYDDKINNNNFEIEQNNSTINLVSQNFGKIQNEINETRNKLEDVKNAIAERNNKKIDLEKMIRESEKVVKEFDSNLEKANNELNNKYRTTQNFLAKISEVKDSHNEKNQKSHLLESLLKAQNEGRLQGIYGRLGDLGTIDSKYDIAVTTACSYLDSIVVESVDHSQKCIEFLRKNNLGRATTIILEKIGWVTRELDKGFRAPNNNCERLFDLVKPKNDRFKAAFYFGLRDTLVTTDLRAAKEVGYGSTRHRVVTLNGELIETSGTMSGGGKPKRGGMSSRVEEEYSQDYINKLHNEYDLSIKDYESCKLERNGLEQRFLHLKTNLSQLNLTRAKLDNELTQLEKERSNLESLNNRLTKDFDRYKKDIDNIENLKNKNENLTAANQKIQTESESIRMELNQIDSEIQKIGGEDFNKKKEELKGMKKRLDTLEKEITNMKQLQENALDILERIKDDIELKEKQQKEYENQIQKLKSEIESLEKQGEAIIIEIEECDKVIQELHTKSIANTKEFDELKSLIKKFQSEKEKFNLEISEINAEVKKNEINVENASNVIDKNIKSFKKLIDEFGFIDEFESELKKINSKKNVIPDQMDVEIEIEKEESADAESQGSKNLEEEINNLANKPAKSRKIDLLRTKYDDIKYIYHKFKIDELNELSQYAVIYVLTFRETYLIRLL
jgi:structural maintenance of chromosome 4